MRAAHSYSLLSRFRRCANIWVAISLLLAASNVGLLVFLRSANIPAHCYPPSPYPVFRITKFFHTGELQLEVIPKITIATQLSVDRLDRLQLLCGDYAGLISAAIYIKSDADELRATDFVQSSACPNADIHLVYRDQNNLYPANTLRNVAVQHVRTAGVLLVDVDFALSNEIANLELPPANTALVLPAFDVYLNEKYPQLPTQKSLLLTMIQDEMAAPVNLDQKRGKYFPWGHQDTDFQQWYTATAPYEATYRYPFEPYFVVNTQLLPRWDERLRGYGEDKAQQVLHMARAGFRFQVHPTQFVIHREHQATQGDTGWGIQNGRTFSWCDRLRDLQAEYDREYGVESRVACSQRHCGY
eukprot:TRINITY_DN8470_c0_g1_i2.p1 TRINITY_DN8470_c0_g1~~TRINITY_DN8470_c0_g1_i2.p1  ORF type:complete len:357 (+),score=50.18 TRINITY_DN8470_c0_g1_i2:105-1175(+)